MEKRSRRRIRNLVALAAFKGLSENEIGCARISMMAGSDAAPSKGRIQKRKTNPLQIVKSSLQRTAGPYISATKRLMHHSNFVPYSITSSARASRAGEILRPSAFAVFRLTHRVKCVGSSTGKSAGRAPLRTRSASAAARR
jgi:hypothetical protein